METKLSTPDKDGDRIKYPWRLDRDNNNPFDGYMLRNKTIFNIELH